MANQGHYGDRPGTRQGIYVCSPSGKFLASINSTNADRVLAMMQEGLAVWDRLPADERELAETNRIKPRHRWEDSFPAGGMILSVLARDLPEQCDPTMTAEAKWNQDQVWFSKEEARQWLSDDPQVGESHEVPDRIVERLTRFHFVDNVKGQTPSFSKEGVQGSSITTEVLSRDGSSIELKLTGETVGVAAEGLWQSSNGVVTRLMGTATFDLENSTFARFEAIALGKRWGYTRFNGRQRDADEGPLGYVIQLRDSDSYRIAPASIWSYDADWVIPPWRR